MSRHVAEVDAMQPLIEEHLEAIRSLCREFGVSKLELFGSAATDAFDPRRSDVDFIVHYPDDYDFGPWLAHYFELRNRLQVLLGRPVDLVMASAIKKPRFIQSINITRRVMFDAA